MKVGYVSHSPTLSSGIGVVSRKICDGMHEQGFELVCLGAGQDEQGFDPHSLPYRVLPTRRGDLSALSLFPTLVQDEKPDVIFLHAELPTVQQWVSLLVQLDCRTPVMIYFSVEATPIHDSWLEALRVAARAACYTHCGAEEVTRQIGLKVEPLNLGVDREVFSPGDPDERRKIRQAIGWKDRFVAMYVAANIATKQHPVLIRAMGEVRRLGHEDILCYMHTVPFNKRAYGGWDLPRIARHWNAEPCVVFPPGLHRKNPYADLRKDASGVDLAASAEENLSRLDLVNRYRCADLYFHVSSCEGFGLPLVEAMACGLPVVHGNDNAAMNEVCGDAGFRIEPGAWETTSFEGQLLALNHSEIARKMIELRGKFSDPSVLAKARRQSLRRASELPWEPTVKRLCELVVETEKAGRWRAG